VTAVHVLAFYALTSVASIIGWPVIRRVSGIESHAAAHMAAKVCGLLFLAYPIWLLGSLGPFDYQIAAPVLFLLALALGGLDIARWLRAVPAEKRRKIVRAVAAVEGVGLLLYLAYLFIRSFKPEIFGTERMMDMALLQGAGRTHYFPFVDPWYAGKTVNYYYYGAYLVSLIANLSRTPYVIAYSCALGLVYSNAALLAALVVREYGARWRYAILAGYLVTTAGTSFYAGCVMIEGAKTPPQVCSYASSTRLFTPSYIINEIPSYSFTVGDLHAHVLSLQIFLLALLLIGWVAKADRPPRLLLGTLALVVASAGLTNSWDALSLSLVIGLLVLARIVRRMYQTKNYLGAVLAEWTWITAGAAIAAATFALIVPFLMKFVSPVSGIRFVPSYVAIHQLTNVQWPTPPSALLGIWGMFAAGIGWGAVAARARLAGRELPIVLAVAGGVLILFVEVFFVPDIYSVANPAFFRANTTFKFGYHTWSLLSIACVMLLSLTLSEGTRRVTRKTAALPAGLSTKIAKVAIAAAVFASLFYPYQALRQFYGLTSSQRLDQGLDGMAFMRREGPGDYEAIEFMRHAIRERSVVLEAAGDSYQYFGRVSAFAGSIAPVNWLTHEWGWRLDSAAAAKALPKQQVETGYGKISAIANDVREIYETHEAERARVLLERYGVRYVYLGALERNTYKNLSDAKFRALGQTIYEAGGVTIFEIRSEAAATK